MAWMHPQDRLFCEIAVQLNLLSREQVARCMQMQQREAGGQTIAALATTLGFLDQAAVDRVMHQQQRVLERRREAREASRRKREAESRAAAGLAPAAASQGEPARAAAPSSSGARVPRAREPTPTAPWVQDGQPASRLSGEEAVPKGAELLDAAQLDSNEVRETLDVRPPQRQVGRATLRDKQAPANDVRPHAAGVQVTAPLPHARAPELPPGAAGPPSVSPTRRTGAGLGPTGPQLVAATSGADPSARSTDDAARAGRVEGRDAAGAARRGEGGHSGLPLGAAGRTAGSRLDPHDGDTIEEVRERTASPGLQGGADSFVEYVSDADTMPPLAGSDAARPPRARDSLDPLDHAGAIAPTAPVDVEAVEAQHRRAAWQRTQLGTGPAFSPDASEAGSAGAFGPEAGADVDLQPGAAESADAFGREAAHAARSQSEVSDPTPAETKPSARDGAASRPSAQQPVSAPPKGAMSMPPRAAAGASASASPPPQAAASGSRREASGQSAGTAPRGAANAAPGGTSRPPEGAWSTPPRAAAEAPSRESASDAEGARPRGAGSARPEGGWSTPPQGAGSAAASAGAPGSASAAPARAAASSGAPGASPRAAANRTETATAREVSSLPSLAATSAPPRGAMSMPPPAAASGAPPRAALGMRGTLLETSGREQERHEQEKPAPGTSAAVHPAVGTKSARPVPSGRDWRNPSRPPPPSVGLDIELSPLTASTPQPPLGRVIKAPALDTPRYIDRSLELCAELGGSDLYVYAGSVPCLRIDGRLWPLSGEQRLPHIAAERVIAEVLDDNQLMQLSLDGELCCSYQPPGAALRARLHAFGGEQGMNVALHLLPAEAPPAERIGLGPALRVLRESPWGLCICSGPAGSGKTTSLWSLTRALASERALHVVSLESPLELQFPSGLGLCEQREVGRHVASYAEGIEWALSEAADVIVVGDLLAPGAFAASLRASRARCLVLAGMRASSSLGALSRLLSEPPQEAELLRFELSSALRLLLHQRLVPKAKVAGRTAAFEQLVNTAQVAQLIRDDKLQQLPTVLASSKGAGMSSLDDALDELVRASTITLEAARAAARRSERFSAKGG